MENESLKDILLNNQPGDYEKIMHHTITQEDIIDFKNLYFEFTTLENDYQKMIFGRKEAAKVLVNKLKLLEQISDLIARGIRIKKSNYEDSTRDLKDVNVKEQYKILEVLKQLASNDLIQYEIKKIEYIAFDSSDHYGYRTIEKYPGEITILAKKEALSKLTSSNQLSCLKKEMLINIYNQGYSMILVGNDENMTERLNIKNVQKLGYYYPLIFYLQDDELANATSLLMNFIEDNGSDLANIEIEDLVQAIKSKYIKKLIKK